jgi:hypothetical protein
LRLWVPSGRFAGPIWNPFLAFFAGLLDSASCARFSAIITDCVASLFSCSRQCSGEEGASGILASWQSQSIRDPKSPSLQPLSEPAAPQRGRCAPAWCAMMAERRFQGWQRGSEDHPSSCDLPAAARPPAKTGLAAVSASLSAPDKTHQSSRVRLCRASQRVIRYDMILLPSPPHLASASSTAFRLESQAAVHGETTTGASASEMID